MDSFRVPDQSPSVNLGTLYKCHWPDLVRGAIGQMEKIFFMLPACHGGLTEENFLLLMTLPDPLAKGIALSNRIPNTLYVQGVEPEHTEIEGWTCTEIDCDLMFFLTRKVLSRSFVFKVCLRGRELGERFHFPTPCCPFTVE